MAVWHFTVEGHQWVVRERESEPGTYDADRLSGPHPYGFTSKSSDGSAMAPAEMEVAIADFLTGVNPRTGYLD
ncbi:hypothetical protein [Kineococcus arenarius]|uniref:hypothetical protein n=1 Tax=Kineococcus sp. SYSU DK007 TaxID=3383128 RepID=UPI003D7EC06D